jgi:maltooligosyltrehalose synthase
MTNPANQPGGTAIPVSTYRLQFNKQFTFSDATRLVSYLRQLGISHCYASPYLKARPGSSHGYDIVDHNELNPEIGSHEDFERFIAELRRNGMGLITDIVPNHMGIMGTGEWPGFLLCLIF